MRRLKYILTILFLIGSPTAYAAISLDATSTSPNASNVSSISFDHTTGAGDNRLMLININCSDNDAGAYSADTVQYNSASATPLAQIETSSNNNYQEAWYLVAPDAGTHTISISDGSGFSCDNLSAEAITFTGVDQTSPIHATNTAFNLSNSDPSGTIDTTITDSIIIDFTLSSASFTTATVGANQTQMWNISTGNGNRRISSTENAPTASTYTMSWDLATDNPWTMVLTSLTSASAQAPVTVNENMKLEGHAKIEGGTLKIE